MNANKDMIIYEVVPEYVIDSYEGSVEEFVQKFIIDRYERSLERPFVLKKIKGIKYEFVVDGSARLMNAKHITIESKISNRKKN